MFRIVQFDILLKYVALVTSAISIALYTLIQHVWLPDFSLFKIVTISSIVITGLIFILLSSFFSRKIWYLLGMVNRNLYPDLNGSWEGEVTLENGCILNVRAAIRQTLLTTQIDMHGETTKSITLETTPTIEQGQKKLYYVYRSTPKDPKWHSYNGTTLFDIRHVEDEKGNYIELSGNYYTDRKSIGRIQIRQVCSDSNKDVSFY